MTTKPETALQYPKSEPFRIRKMQSILNLTSLTNRDQNRLKHILTCTMHDNERFKVPSPPPWKDSKLAPGPSSYYEVYNAVNPSNTAILLTLGCISCIIAIVASLFSSCSELLPPFVFLAFYTPVDSTALVTGGYREICEASTKNGTIRNKAVCPGEFLLQGR